MGQDMPCFSKAKRVSTSTYPSFSNSKSSPVTKDTDCILKQLSPSNIPVVSPSKSNIKDMAESPQNQNKEKPNFQNSPLLKHMPSLKFQHCKSRSKRSYFDNLNITHRLGGGGFGNVYLGFYENKQSPYDRDKSNKVPYAIKQMKKSKIHERKLVSNIILQKKIMKTMICNFIAKSYYTFRDKQYYYIAMQWAQGGDVFSLLKPESARRQMFERLGEDAIRFILGCVVLGLQFLHSKNIIYGDMKPQNLLIFEDGYVKLSDFGISHEFKKDCAYYINMGTQMYFAPEVVMRSQCKRYVDLWTLGVLAFELANFTYPFGVNLTANPKKFVNDVIKSETKRIWDNQNSSPELKSLVDGLLKFEPRIRLGASGWNKIKNHSFFTKAKFDWVSLEQKKIESPLLPLLEHKIQYKKIQNINIRPEYCLMNMDDHQTIDGWTSECHSRII